MSYPYRTHTHTHTLAYTYLNHTHTMCKQMMIYDHNFEDERRVIRSLMTRRVELCHLRTYISLALQCGRSDVRTRIRVIIPIIIDL